MIQRIQSFYLVLALCAMVLCFLFPTATYTSTEGSCAKLQLIPEQVETAAPAIEEVYPMDLDDEMYVPEMPTSFGTHAFDNVPVWLMVAMAVAIGLIALGSIFMYTNRVRQMRVAACGFLLSVIYVGFTFLWWVDAAAHSKNLIILMGQQPETHYSVGAFSPIVAAVLFFLAQRAIKRDEEKVRAADRLR